MADAGNWWDSSSRTRYESGASSSSSSAAVNPTGAFAWPAADMPDMIKSTSSMDPPGTGLVDPNLHLMGLGLPSHHQALDWNQTLISASFGNDHSGVYGNPGLLGSTDHPNQNQNQYHQTQQQQQSHDYQFNTHVHASYNYGMNNNEFGRTASDLRPPSHSPLHFSNNTPFWNSGATNEVFPSLQSPSFGDHHRPSKINMGEAGDEKTMIKKSGNSEAASKRPRNESPLPPFKVRKEKMGDRITALQQLVSPFGKTDTASVLSEAIEYIKFLHEQVSVLTTPYLKSGAPLQHQHQQGMEEPEGAKQDLRSRGLCLVPVSSTFPVTHETTVDFWTPTFGGTFR